MALCPFAERKLLPENATQARITPRAVIAHSAGGEAELYGWWHNDQSRGLESHFWIGRDGRIVQYIDTEVRADANGEANGYAVSIETQSTKQAAERWDPPQAAALVRLIDWLCTAHRIPRRLMTSPTGSGLAWHVQFGAPGPWTKAAGKVCPGPARIEQYCDEIVPAVANGTPTTTDPEEFTMDAAAEARFDDIDARLARIEQGVLIDIGEGRDDATEGGSLAKVVGSIKGWVKAVAIYGRTQKERNELAELATQYDPTHAKD